MKESAAPSPLTDSEWASVVDAMSLTPRQAEIINLILRGNGDKQIASSLAIGLPTVRTHLRQVFALHRVDSRVQLVLRVFEIARNT